MVVGQPGGEVRCGADQLDGQALVPVEGVDEFDEEWLAVGVARVIQCNQPHSVDRLRPDW